MSRSSSSSSSEGGLRGETALNFLADVVNSRDTGDKVLAAKRENGDRRKRKTDSLPSRWLPQSILLPLNSDSDGNSLQDGKLIGEIGDMMPSATLESIDIDDPEDDQDGALKRASKRSRKSVQDEATKDMITGFFQKAGDGDGISSSKENAVGGRVIAATEQRLSNSARDDKYKLRQYSTPRTSIGTKGKEGSTRSNEQFAAEILTRIPSEDLHANSRDWQDSNFANGLSLGESGDGGFTLQAVSGELADPSLSSDIFRSASNSAFGRGVFSADSLDVQDGVWIYPATMDPNNNNLKKTRLLGHTPQSEGIVAGMGTGPLRNKVCPKCGMFWGNNLAHVCVYSKSPHIQFQSPGRKYFVENSNQYNAFMLQKYTGISTQGGDHQTTLEDVSRTAERPSTPTGGDSKSASVRKVRLQIKLVRSVVPAEISMLGKDAKEHIASLLKHHLLQVNRLAGPRLDFHQKYIEKVSVEQNQMPESKLKRTLTMTGGGMSVGPYQSVSTGKADSIDSQKRHAREDIPSAKFLSSDPEESRMVDGVASLIESMEEYVMNYAMRLKEKHEENLEEHKSKYTLSGNEQSNGGEALDGSGIKIAESLLESKFARFTNQIENYLGPMFYTRGGGAGLQGSEIPSAKYDTAPFRTAASMDHTGNTSSHSDVFATYESVLKELYAREERGVPSSNGNDLQLLVESINPTPSTV